MRASKEVYENVAKNCSEYELKHVGATNCACDPSCKSCLNCSHFTQSEHCTLDLYDKIVKNI